MLLGNTTAFKGLLEFSIYVMFKTKKDRDKNHHYIITDFIYFPASLILIAGMSHVTESTA